MPDIWDKIADDVGADTHNIAATSVIRQRRNPALVARARKLSEKYGVPSPIIEEQPEPYEAQARKDVAEETFEQHPWMVPMFAQDPDMSNLLGEGDLPKLGEISKVFGYTTPAEPIDLGAPITIDTIKPTRPPKTPPPVPGYGKRVLRTTGAVVGTAVNQIIGAASGVVENVTDVIGLNEELDPVFRRLEEARRKSDEALMNEVSGWVTPGVKRGAFSAATSLTTLGATAPAGAARILPLLAGITYGDAYQKYQGRDVGVGMSMVGAGIEGGLEYTTERLPVGYLTSKLGKGSIRDFMTHVVLGETVGEQIATAGQSLTEAMIAPETPTSFKDWLTDPARGQEAWETLVASTLMTGAIGGTNMAARRLMKASDTAVDTTDALIGQAVLDDIMAKAEKVEMRTTSPEDFARFLNEGAKGSPVKNVYIPVEAIDTVLQDETLDDEDKAALTLFQDQIDEARVNNGEVVIPIGEAAATFAGTKVWEKLREDTRVLAGGISGREAKEQMDTIVEELEAIGNQTIEEARAAAPALAEKAAVFAEVKAQVLAAGRSPKEAQTTAALLASRAETLASPRYGQFKNAMEAWQWMQLRVVGADAKVSKGKKVAQAPFKDVTTLLERDDWALVSAANPNAQPLSDEENEVRMAELAQALDAMGLTYQRSRGVYDNEEPSFAIEGITQEQAMALGERFGQDSVLTRRGFIYRDRTVHPATGVTVLGADADNYFTELPDGTKFQIGIDFSAKVPLDVVEETTFGQDDLTESERASSLAGALAIARSQRWPAMRAFKMAIQTAVKAGNKSNLRDRARITRIALADAREALKTNANAIGWYNDKVVHALETFSAIHPEIGTSEEAKFAFIYALAVTSNGLKVNANFKLANKVYTAYKKTGQMPIIGEGNAGKAMQSSFALFNTLTERMGILGLRDFMVSARTVKEVEGVIGVKVTGENATTRVTGAAFLGPKIGNGFFSNLYGDYTQLTMDRWFIRTWGRWTGTLISEDKAEIKRQREITLELMRSLTPAERKQVNKILSGKKSPFTFKISDPEGFAAAVTRKTGNAAVRDALEAINPRLRLDPKNYYKALDGQKEAPKNGGERNEIRSIMLPVLAELQVDNPDLTMADLQAVLWYPEKTLYDTSKAKYGVLTAEGYENDEAPDYANAAVALARSLGISEEAINAANERAGRRLAAAKRSGRTERGAGDTIRSSGSITIPEDGNGFPLEEGLSSAGDGTHDPLVLQQFGGRVGAGNISGFIPKLYRAQAMEQAGATPEDIWRLTGWVRAPDTLWRFEIDDHKAYLKDMPNGDRHDLNTITPGIDYDYSQPTMGASSEDGSLIYIGERLETVLHHPALFQHYPQLRNVGVFQIPFGDEGRTGGYFDGFNIVINTDAEMNDEEILSVVHHEIQHAIQSIEGHTNGASPNFSHFEELGIVHEYQSTLARYMAINDGVIPGWSFGEVKRTDEQLEASARYSVYMRVLGEVEARNTQFRKDFNPTARRDLFPFSPDSIDLKPGEDIIVPVVEPMYFLAAQSTKQPSEGPKTSPRGEATFYPDGRTVVQLFGKADFSTMLHEMSHVFLQQEFTLAKDPKASEELKRDVATLTKWFTDNGGALDKNGMPDVTSHELFARTGERYFREGKAPSADLREPFKQFKTWLTGVYQSVKDLLAFGPAPINPEIREIMDRMIATENEIELNATAPLSQEQLGMTDSEYAAYLDSVQGARDDGFDILLDRMMKAIRRRETQKGREHRAAIRAEIAERVNAEPRWIALHLLRTGRWLGDPQREAMPIKINTGWLIDNYGDEILSQLPVGLQPLHRGDGVVGDDVAALVGEAYTGDALVRDLVEIKRQADELKAAGNPRPLRDHIIEAQVDLRIAAEGGDIAMSEQEIEQEAIAALNSTRQGEVLAAELRQLRKIKAKPGVITPYQMLREWARRKVNEGTVDEAVSKSALQRYVRAYNKARNLFEEAILGGKSDEAIKQKQAQMINHALLAEGKIVADEINVIVKRMARYARTKAISSIDQDYLDRIHELLEGYNFRPVSDKTRAEKVSFERWAETQRAMGHEVHVPDRFRDDRVNWKDAKVAKLLELNDMVLSLVSQGKLKQRLTTAAEQRALQETIDEAEARILALPPRTLPEASTGQESRPFRQRLSEAKTFREHVSAVTSLFSVGSRVREGAAGLIKIEGLMDILDGEKQGTGPLNQFVVQPATDAANEFSRLLEEVMDPIIARYKGMSRKQSARLRDFITIDELTLNVSIHEADTDKIGKPLTIPRMKLIGLLLNTGNLSNLSKLVGGERWGDPESATDLARVRDVLVSYASKEDMDLVQDIWNGVSKLWPHIARVERELSGIVPEQVVPLDFETPYGPYSGGYWPVVWDSTRSEMGKKQGEEAETSLQGVGFGIATPKGHTITRTGAMAPMEWSVEHVLFGHLNKVISRVAYAPWVRNTLKLVDHPRITGAIRLRLGNEYVSAIKPWIRDQIPSNMADIQGAKLWEKFLDGVRVNMSIAVLGISYTTGVAQALGLGYSAGTLGEGSVKAGGRWMMRGLLEAIKLNKNGMTGAQEFVFARSEEMKRRSHEVSQEASEVFRRLRDHDSVYRRMQAAAFWHIGFIDINMVAIPTWLGGYHKALSEGLTEAEAIHYAEKMVRLSQSSGRKKDLSAIQRGNAGQKFIAMFYTPSSVFFNQQWEAAQHLKAGNWSKALAPTFYFLVMTTLADAMREGDWPEDDDEDGLGGMDVAEWVGRNLLFGAFYGIPVVRDATNSAERQLRGEYSEYGTTPISALASAVSRGVKSTKKAVEGEEFEGKDLKNQAVMVGYLLGLPGNQLGKSAGFVKDVYDGRVEANDPYDWYHGLAYGKPPAEQE